VGLFGPARLPGDIASRLTTETRRVLAYPETRSTLRRSYLEPVGSNGEDLFKVLVADTEKWARLARERNLRFSEAGN
jgi:tripartite-type tricarboxylate transporter receptor subunit TctC